MSKNPAYWKLVDNHSGKILFRSDNRVLVAGWHRVIGAKVVPVFGRKAKGKSMKAKGKSMTEDLGDEVDGFCEAFEDVVDARRELREAEGLTQMEQIRQKRLADANACFVSALRGLLERLEVRS